MSAETTPLAYLASLPIETIQVDDTWNAITVPSSWGALVLDVLGDQSGPAFVDPVYQYMSWIIPPGGAADWPDALDAGVDVCTTGDWVTVPGPEGHASGIQWLRPPKDGQLTNSTTLRAALEFVIGPLAEASQPDAVKVCQYCGAPTRDAKVVSVYYSPTASGHVSYACRSCYGDTATGGGGRHLHIVRRGPR
ncbi:hypothetical protein [Streptomyces lydicus]|uniref:hypothetical protein n=1 Tax=Streptomyces lydicus TaxID=47763 RepID=UPI001010E3E0|nr:hypothetical protein [Streptomyces lydicus]MCZ1012288.1 hypothetical protein [Streptomyces lydicus]